MRSGRFWVGILLAALVSIGTVDCDAILGIGNPTVAGDRTGSASDAMSTADAAEAADAADADAARDATTTDASSQDGCADGGCLVCEAGIACAGQCIDPVGDPANCGGCGHDCGGGACQSSRCQPVALVSSIDVPSGFAIDSTSIYFGVDGVIQSCPLDGCQNGMTQIVEGFNSIDQIATTSDLLLFIAQSSGSGIRIGGAPAMPQAVYACPKGPCTSPETVMAAGLLQTVSGMVPSADNLFFQLSGCSGPVCTSADSYSYVSQCVGFASGCDGGVVTVASGAAPIAADGNSVYFTYDPQSDSGVQPELVSCPLNGACPAPAVLESPGPTDSTELLSYGGSLFFNAQADAVFLGSSLSPVGLYACSDTNCSSRTQIADLPEPVNSFAVDSSGAYFTSGSGVYVCPSSGCGQDAVALASGQASPQLLLTDDQFVYWVDGDMALADGGLAPDTASILRVAK